MFGDVNMEKKFDSIKKLKRDGKLFHFKVSTLKNMVMLQPHQAYVKEYGNGDHNKACEDLSKWYGLFGTINDDGSITMQVRDEVVE